MVIYYQHNQTTPTYMKGIKLVSGDEFLEDEYGTITVKRNGNVIYPATIEEDVNTNIPFEEVEDDEIVEDDEEIISLEEMTKIELEDFAKEVYGIDLDRRKSKNSMINKIKQMEKGDTKW